MKMAILGTGAKRAVSKTITRLSQEADKKMKLRSPVITGHLRGSVTRQRLSGSDYSAIIRPTAEYAEKVEEGWYNNMFTRGKLAAKLKDGKPYVRGAREDVEKIAQEVLEEEVDKLVAQVMLKRFLV